MKITLDRFVEAQDQYDTYEKALEEIRNGKKVGHYMWFIFPQLKGLGFSLTSDYYGLRGIDEVLLYYRNNALRNRLLKLTNIVYNLDVSNIEDVFGETDSLKLKSCMTVFEYVQDLLFTEPNMFRLVLDKHFKGNRCDYTLQEIDKYAQKHLNLKNIKS